VFQGWKADFDFMGFVFFVLAGAAGFLTPRRMHD
jgi:hypothetical protein